MATAPAPDRPRFERVAHRGAPRERRENTLPSFLLALERGADAIELDVHASREGIVVVHHDPSVNGREIATESWAELKQLNLAGNARMPRLADVLQEIGDRATVYIEVKGRNIEAAVVSVAQTYGRRYALHSFDHSAIARVAELSPDVPRGILLDRGTPDAPSAMRAAVDRIRPRDVWPHFSLVDAPLMQAAAELGVRVIPWTVNAPNDARRLLSHGVHGLCSDDVRLLANL
jgi:glycerophosphoryl diester phosphodiesterase